MKTRRLQIPPKKSAIKDNSSDKDKTAKDKDTKTSKSVFFSKSSAPTAADPDSEDESYEPRAYVVNAIQANFLTSSEGGSHAMPAIVSDDDSLPGLIDDLDDDSLPGLIDDSDSEDDSDMYVDALWTITFQVHQDFARCSHWVLLRLLPSLIVWKTTYRGC